MQTSSVDIQGMTCGGCAGKVQRPLSNLDGVSHVEVSLRLGIATVHADPARVTSAQIESVIATLGYSAQVRTADTVKKVMS